MMPSPRHQLKYSIRNRNQIRSANNVWLKCLQISCNQWISVSLICQIVSPMQVCLSQYLFWLPASFGQYEQLFCSLRKRDSMNRRDLSEMCNMLKQLMILNNRCQLPTVTNRNNGRLITSGPENRQNNHLIATRSTDSNYHTYLR